MFAITSFQNYDAYSVRKPVFAGKKCMNLAEPQEKSGDVFISGAITLPKPSSIGERVTMVAEQPVTALLNDDLTSHEICQGEHSNCYFWAAIGRLLHQPEGKALLDTITVKQELDPHTGKMMVVINYNMVDKTVEFDLDELGKEQNGQKTGDAPEVLQMLELGYMILSRSRRNSQLECPYPNDGIDHMGLIANYGNSAEVFTDMFGGTDFGVEPPGDCFGQSFSDYGKPGIDLVKKKLTRLEKNKKTIYFYTAFTPTKETRFTSVRDSNGEVTVQNGHYYAITNVDLDNNAITIWDPEPSTGVPQTQVITMEAFCELFGRIDGVHFNRDSLRQRLGVG